MRPPRSRSCARRRCATTAHAWFNLGVVRLRLDNRAGALQAFEHAVAHAATREQATAEIDRIKAAR